MKNHFLTFVLVISYFSVFSQSQSQSQYLTDIDPIRGYSYEQHFMGVLNHEESLFSYKNEVYVVNTKTKEVKNIGFDLAAAHQGAYTTRIEGSASNKSKVFFITSGNFGSKYSIGDDSYALHSYSDGELETFDFDERKLPNGSNPKIVVSDDAVYLTIDPKKTGDRELEVYKFDNDLNLIWKSEEGITLNTQMEVISKDVAVDNGFVITIKITPDDQKTFTLVGSKLPKSGLAFLTFDEKGKLNVITPQFPENFYALTSSFPMLNNEVIGVLFINDLETSNTTSAHNNGYIYIKWNTDGSVKEFKKKYFSYQDLKSTDLEEHLKKFRLNESAFDDGKGGMVAMRPRTFDTKFLKDGSVVCFSSAIGVGFKQALLNSKLIFRISNEGELDWTKFYPGDNPEYFALSNINIDETKGNIRLLSCTHKGVVSEKDATFEKNGFRFAIIDRSLSLETGESDTQKYLDFPEAAGYEISNIFSGYDSFLVQFNRKTSYKICPVLVD